MTLRFRKVKASAWNSAWRWVPGVIAATVTLVCVEIGVFQVFQALTYNALFRSRGSMPWDERIVVVEIDDRTIQEIGQFPVARRYYAQFLNQLDEAQPSVVAFDIVFAESSADDEAFAEAMDRLNRIVLAQSWDNRGQPVLPDPDLVDHAINLGHVLNLPTDDGVSRSVQPYIQGVPVLGIAIAQSYSLVAEAIAIPDNHHTNTQDYWINWPGSSRNCQSYSFIDVLEGTVPLEPLQNKIVLVGVTASGSNPLFTPFDRKLPTGGVYLQAAVVNNLLRQNELYRTGAVWKLLILVLGGPVLNVLSSSQGCRYRQRSWLGFCIGWNLISLIFLKLNILLPMFWPIVLVTLTTGLTETVERSRANRHLQRKVEQLWDAYHSDLIVWKRPVLTLLNRNSTPVSQPRKTKADLDAVGMRPSLDKPVAVQRAMQLAQLAEMFGRSQSLHAAIARSLSVGLVAADWDGQVWLCNPFAETLMGLKVGELLVSRLTPTWVTMENWNQYILQLSESQSPCWETQQNDRWFEVRLEPLFYNRHEAGASANHRSSLNSESTPQHPAGLLLLIQDITTFKYVEEEIRNALAEALELSELKTRFVSMASHELRTPLTIMQTSVDLLRVHGLTISDGKYDKYLTRIEDSVVSMLKLIENVLMLGRSETRYLKLKPQPLPVESFCKDLIAQLPPSGLVEKRIRFVPNLDRECFMLDCELLSLILSNLLSNALKYSPTESPIDLNVFSSEAGITFEIRDRGIGIPTDYQAHLFEEFHRAKNVGDTPGTGLGLSIVKRCVDLHGGTIDLESTVGFGTTFRVHFPKSITG